MKKFRLICCFSIFFITYSFSFSFAGSPETPRDQELFEGSGYLSEVEVIPDNFGGNLYFYEDQDGNRCVSNSLDNIKGIRLARTEESDASSAIPGTGGTQKPLILAELEDDEYDYEYDEDEDYFDEYETFEDISDPFEPVNRVFFHFNDKLYYWLLKPAASGYKAIVPEPARISVKNFFSNLSFPVRFINCVFQGKFEGAGYEVGRFLTNSTIGLAGFFDVATKDFNMKEYDEDLGQTLGFYGLGHGFYICWPFLGPSSLRDTIGDAGDEFLDPVYYLDLKRKYELSIKAYEKVNDVSLILGEYEDLKEAALDPYIALRDVYFQYRAAKTKE